MGQRRPGYELADWVLGHYLPGEEQQTADAASMPWPPTPSLSTSQTALKAPCASIIPKRPKKPPEPAEGADAHERGASLPPTKACPPGSG